MEINTGTGHPIIIDDESVSDGSDDESSKDNGSKEDEPTPCLIKQVLWSQQRHVERLRSFLANSITYIGNTTDSDQSSDHRDVRVGEKQSFEDFIIAEMISTSKRYNCLK
jgi:hypothetical protein